MQLPTPSRQSALGYISSSFESPLPNRVDETLTKSGAVFWGQVTTGRVQYGPVFSIFETISRSVATN